ncbi:hypothetical protein PHYSODRAFT_410753, partial [Phytophthora sojae]
EGLVDYYDDPHKMSAMDKSAKDVGTGSVYAPACGDVMKLYLSMDHCRLVVHDNRLRCGWAIVFSSVTT